FVSSSSSYIVSSSDSGKTWSKIKIPYEISDSEKPTMIGTPNNLLLYYFKDKVNIIYQNNDTGFVESKGKLPDTENPVNIKYSNLNNGIVFFSEKTGTDISFYSTNDGANTLEKTVLKNEKDSSLLEIKDIKKFYIGDTKKTYVSAIYKGSDNKNYVQIKRSVDDKPFGTLYSSESIKDDKNVTSLLLDIGNKVHAIKHWTDSSGYEYNYNGNFLLE
ncbi:MAG: hypothetical protein ACK4IX_11955, partial [Candidatus Sericytochromatia bacterium]